MKYQYILIAAGVLGVFASQYDRIGDWAGSQRDFVGKCTAVLEDAGEPQPIIDRACSCLEGKANADKAAGREVTESRFRQHFDNCMAPLAAAMDARSAWAEDAAKGDAEPVQTSAFVPSRSALSAAEQQAMDDTEWGSDTWGN